MRRREKEGEQMTRCSRCKREVTDQEPISTIKVICEKEAGRAQSTEDMCLCPDCMEAFMRFKFMVDAFETDEVKEPHINEKKHIDYGKIISLYRAGWTIGQIAEDMDTTKGTVAWVISNYRQRGGRTQ